MHRIEMRSRSNIRYECTKSSKRWLNVTLCESSDQLSRNRKWGVRGGGLWTIVLWTLPHAPWMFLTSLTVSRWCLDILVSGCQSNDHEGGVVRCWWPVPCVQSSSTHGQLNSWTRDYVNCCWYLGTDGRLSTLPSCTCIHALQHLLTVSQC